MTYTPIGGLFESSYSAGTMDAMVADYNMWSCRIISGRFSNSIHPPWINIVETNYLITYPILGCEYTSLFFTCYIQCERMMPVTITITAYTMSLLHFCRRCNSVSKVEIQLHSSCYGNSITGFLLSLMRSLLRIWLKWLVEKVSNC